MVEQKNKAMKKSYVLIQYGGEYEDKWEKPVGIFVSKELIQKVAKRMNTENEEIEENYHKIADRVMPMTEEVYHSYLKEIHPDIYKKAEPFFTDEDYIQLPSEVEDEYFSEQYSFERNKDLRETYVDKSNYSEEDKNGLKAYYIMDENGLGMPSYYIQENVPLINSEKEIYEILRKQA